MENIREGLNNEEAKEILEKLNEEYQLEKVQDMIRDNKIEFEFEGKQYRVRLLTTKEKDELDYLRRKYFGKLLQDKDILMEKDLIRIYKERGLDIEEEFDKKIDRIQNQISECKYKLGEALANKAGDVVLESYRRDIEDLTKEAYMLVIKKGHLLENSFEQTLINYVAKVMSWLSLEVKDGENWKRAFNSLEDYLQADDELINLSAIYSTALMYRV